MSDIVQQMGITTVTVMICLLLPSRRRAMVTWLPVADRSQILLPRLSSI